MFVKLFWEVNPTLELRISQVVLQGAAAAELRTREEALLQAVILVFVQIDIEGISAVAFLGD